MKVLGRIIILGLLAWVSASEAVNEVDERYKPKSCTLSTSSVKTTSLSSTLVTKVSTSSISSSSSILVSTPTSTSSSSSATPSVTGVDTNGLIFDYPHPIHLYNFTSQRLNLQMAYMDVSPINGSTKGTIVLLHGKNFCGATWNHTIDVMLGSGYRVIVPDQVGFCKSTKPNGYQFSIMQLATNTNNLLKSLNVTSATIMGHSMGGMISIRYTLMFPSQVARLVMVDPLGLENWFQKGTPYQTIDVSYQTELAVTFTSIKTYENSTYYSGMWESRYDIWVQMLVDVYTGSQGPQFAYNMAQTTDMIFTQPVFQELGNLSTISSILLIGKNDNTAIGKAWTPVAIRPSLGNYKVLGIQANAIIGSNNTLVEFDGLGHAPQIEDPDRFFAALMAWLP